MVYNIREGGPTGALALLAGWLLCAHTLKHVSSHRCCLTYELATVLILGTMSAVSVYAFIVSFAALGAGSEAAGWLADCMAGCCVVAG